MKDYTLVAVAAIVLAAVSIECCMQPDPAPSAPVSSDYQITCGNDTLFVTDSGEVVGVIPYSDSSDIWQLLMSDNR